MTIREIPNLQKFSDDEIKVWDKMVPPKYNFLSAKKDKTHKKRLLRKILLNKNPL
jgi:hypothetical protein